MVSTSGNRLLLRGRSSAYTWEIVRHYQPTSPSASCTILWHLPGEIIRGYRVRVDHQLLHGGHRSSLQGQGRSSASPWGNRSSLQGQGRSSASTWGDRSSLQGQGQSSASPWGDRSPLQGQGRSSASTRGNRSSLQGRGRSSTSMQGNRSSLQGQGQSSASAWGESFITTMGILEPFKE